MGLLRVPWGHIPAWGTKKLWTERAWRSQNLFKEEMAKRNTVLTVRNLSGTSSRGSNGALERASRTTAKSHVGILGHTGGLSLLIPRINCIASGFFPMYWSPTGEWWAAIAAMYTLSVDVDNPAGALDCRMVSTTSVERPDAMRCAPSGATTTASTTLGEGDI